MGGRSEEETGGEKEREGKQGFIQGGGGGGGRPGISPPS